MRKLTGKIIIISFVTMMISGSIARLTYRYIIGGDFHPDLSENRIFGAILIALALALVLFTIAMNFFIARRIKDIDKGTLRVMDGDYDFVLDSKGHDEIANLSKNFNLMTNEIKSNEYLNKEFVRNFTHEFKTPLSVIRGYAELLEDNDLTKKEKKNFIDIIISESERLSNLANNMLQISLIDSTSIIAKEDEYNLAEQIRNIIQMIQVMWEEKNLSFNLEIEEVYIKSNKELTYQILLNLLSNSIKFSDDSEEIKISLEEKENSLKFSITNKGQVIPADDYEKVFQLFYIANKSRNTSSTGVGLTLTKKIIDKLNGNISFESKNGLTTFNVELCK
ncbi:MAG: HAMP domain-containing histidine kinase [Tenericutes bacterium]|nr:HAMP domain-containing histidine kinase [Mycoplasmatota bacterium]